MPRLVVYDTGRLRTSQITQSFAKGAGFSANWTVEHLPIKDYLKRGLHPQLNVDRGDCVATLGILRGTGLMMKEAASEGLDYYYMDHAYFNPGYGGKTWMRIVKNGHSCNDLRYVESARWKKNFKPKNTCHPWLKNHERGSKIIICPPTHAVCWFLDIHYDWAEMIKSKLEALLPEEEHSRIVIRRKPKEPIVDNRGNLIELRTPAGLARPSGSLEDDLKDACCVIAYNSMVAMTATLMGIPVITSEHSCCARISYNIEDFKRGPYPDVFELEPEHRSSLLFWLASNQWRINEINDGTAWKHLREFYDNEN
jgi:hypothetical protein